MYTYIPKSENATNTYVYLYLYTHEYQARTPNNGFSSPAAGHPRRPTEKKTNSDRTDVFFWGLLKHLATAPP